jgi:hypothetical protein
MDKCRLDEQATLLTSIELAVLGSSSKSPYRRWSNGIVRETKKQRGCGFENGFKGA